MAKKYAQRFYASKVWKDARSAALRRDKYSCRICGGRAQEVHHVEELTPLNIDDPRVALNLENLLSLCGDCHKSITDNNSKRKDLRNGFYFDADGNVQQSPRGA